MTSRPGRPRAVKPLRTQRLWHPFADMGRLGSEVVFERGEGAWIYDTTGRRYLDGSAGLWYCNVGHGRAELAEAAAVQMRKLASYQIFDRFANQPALELAERLTELTPTRDAGAVFFTSGGSDAVDTAAKIARRYWSAGGHPERQILVAREGAYHGVNAFGTSLSGIPANASGWGVLVPDTVQVDRHSIDALDELLRLHAGQVAAFIAEPVQGAAGVHPPAPGYWSAVQELCRRHDVLLIVDEVVTGFGRLGEWFGSSRFDIRPDLLVCAKGLSSGYMPIGAVVAGERILDVLWSADAGAFRHGYTYSGHPAACAVALANLDIIEEECLIQRVRALEPVLERELRALGAHPMIDEVRAVGLLAGIELSEQRRALIPDLGERVVTGARERGVLVRNLLGKTLQISPPFVIKEEEIAFIAAVLTAVLDDLAAGDV